MNMTSKPLVDFLSDSDLFKAVSQVVDALDQAKKDADKKIYSNVLDPFSAIFEAVYFEMGLSDWLEKEKSRQTQKTMQNRIGEFHQRVIGSIDGWKNLETGQILDVINEKKKVVAEIKNKHNTTKGNHKKTVYDDMAKFLDVRPDFVAYYVEIIPKGAKRYDKPFEPSDNVSGDHRQKNEKIRVIDGYSFYELATGQKDALRNLYKVLPEAIVIVSQRGAPQYATQDKNFDTLFQRAFGVDIS